MTKTTTVTIAEFLLARIAEDEELADRVEFRPYVGEGVPQSLQGRVLTECEAKRRIVAEHKPVDYGKLYGGAPTICDPCQEVDGYGTETVGDRGVWPCPTLRALASVYADHPDYDAEWVAVTAPRSDEKAQKRITIPKPEIHTGPQHLTVDGATVDYLRDAAIRVRASRYWGSGVTALVADLLDSAADAVESEPAYSYDRCLCPHEDTINGPGTGVVSGYTEGCRVHLAPGTGCQNPECGETWVEALTGGICHSCRRAFSSGSAGER